MKKTTKETTTLTPAKKPAKSVRKTSVAPAVKVAPTAVVTTISASIDVGFVNGLYVRGEGPGLSWEKGLRLECTADDKWTVVLGESVRPFVFKFLVNDEVWSTGDDYTVESGASITLTPTF